MEKKITYVTGNIAKIESAKQILEPLGYTVDNIKMETPEIQADDVSEVAKYSVQWACEKLNKSVLKNDSGKPTIKYVNASNDNVSGFLIAYNSKADIKAMNIAIPAGGFGEASMNVSGNYENIMFLETLKEGVGEAKLDSINEVVSPFVGTSATVTGNLEDKDKSVILIVPEDIPWHNQMYSSTSQAMREYDPDLLIEFIDCQVENFSDSTGKTNIPFYLLNRYAYPDVKNGYRQSSGQPVR